MINLKFSIINPWWNRFANIKSWAGGSLFENKFWEVQIMKSDDLLTVDLRITTRQDHAGADLWLGLFGYAINLQFYDNRHWDSETENWQVYNK
jgi:hypothetical protein